eukprot:6536702-Alexandrium_andersonii.AAC.1
MVPKPGKVADCVVEHLWSRPHALLPLHEEQLQAGVGRSDSAVNAFLMQAAVFCLYPTLCHWYATKLCHLKSKGWQTFKRSSVPEPVSYTHLRAHETSAHL